MKWAAIVAMVLAGCEMDAPVDVRFSQTSATPSAGAGYKGDVGTVSADQDGNTLFDSKAGGAELRVSIDQVPSTAGEKVTVGGARHISVEYTVGGSTWGSNSGSVTFATVSSPFRLTFDHVELIGAGTARGSFLVDGVGEYAKLAR